MPKVCHGRKADHPLGPNASNVFKAMKKSGFYEYTILNGKKGKATVSVCVKRAKYKNKHGKRKCQTWVYAYWGIKPKQVNWVKDTYRRRFGIETSYRQMNQCRIRTTTKKFHVRFLYAAIGRFLRNLWVWLHHVVLSSPRRGCQKYNWELLPTLCVVRVWRRSKLESSGSAKRTQSVQDGIPTQSAGTSKHALRSSQPYSQL